MTSRIPVPRSIKRNPSEPIFPYSQEESPSQQKAARLGTITRSPGKGTLLAMSSPSGLVRRMSLAPSGRSPLATPPRRQDKGTASRLSIYGVPVGMNGKTGGATNRRLTMTGAVGGIGGEGGEKRITVCVRKRPLSTAEERQGNDCVQADMLNNSINVSVARTKLDGLNKYTEGFNFSYDRVFDATCSNALIYKQIVAPLVTFAVRGGKATVFAYGQTGSGKTHTMFRAADGLCYQAVLDLLDRCGTLECHVSFFEIYQGHLYDLLQERRKVVPCEQRDGQVKVMGLCEELAVGADEARELIQRGLTTRMTGKTGANSQSSRSHAILQFTLKGSNGGGDLGASVFGRLSFIDLAGSERGADRAEVDRQTKREGSEINKSLLALKECIRALDMDASHLPFRQSKLTLVLKDSIVGNVKTAMIATVSPAISSSEHTLNTLRYAERFHEISGPSMGKSNWENLPPAGNNAEEEEQCDWTVSPVRQRTRLDVDDMPKDGSAKVTPVRTVTFATPDSSRPRVTLPSFGSMDAVAQHRIRISEILAKLQQRVDGCADVDVLELLGEELHTLSQAFKSLA